MSVSVCQTHVSRVSVFVCECLQIVFCLALRASIGGVKYNLFSISPWNWFTVITPIPLKETTNLGRGAVWLQALRRSLGLNLESLIIEQVCQSHLPPSSHCCVPVRSHLLLASLQWMLWGFVLGYFKVSCTYSFMFLGSSSGSGSLGALDRFWPEVITVIRF